MAIDSAVVVKVFLLVLSLIRSLEDAFFIRWREDIRLFVLQTTEFFVSCHRKGSMFTFR